MQRNLRPSKVLASILAVIFAFSTVTAPLAQGAAIPPVGLLPLNQMAVPEPPNLYQFVKNKTAAIRLGKALFWDMQVGSDGVTACGTCHFSAGADNRLTNTLHPGTNGRFDVRDVGQTLDPLRFPFHERQAPADFKGSPVLRDADDVVGSQGVTLRQFVGINQGSAVDSGFDLADAVFQKDGVNVRQVTGRNTPSVINAVFNFTNFWDGRASAHFNGSSPFGPLDQTAGVWYEQNGALVKRAVSLEFASLASQAVGPPLNEVEMSFKGRSFPQLGRKMLSLTPLGKQTVHPDDSVLGSLSRAQLQPDGSLSGSKGLRTSYAQLIRDAFHSNLWGSNLGNQAGFSQMEANFALFWGLAIQLYESTLVSDDTPYDRFLGGDSTALTDQQQDGFNIFFGAGRCDVCHGATELSNASVTAAGFINNADHALLEMMPVASGQQIVYDNGFNNTAVRPTAEDLGRAGLAPFTNSRTGTNFPLSFSDLGMLQLQGRLPFAVPQMIPGLPASFPVRNNGAFKVPGLRNVELTAPYMHNGSMLTLEQVVEFYARGGNFPTENQADLDINIADLPGVQGVEASKAALVAFMKSMTDDRVREEAAPFDRPEILVPSGEPSGTFIRLKAKDLNGTEAPLLPVVTLNPVTTPTAQTSQLIGGTKESGAQVRYRVNGGTEVRVAENTSDTTWSSTVTGLSSGVNTLTVEAADLTGLETHLPPVQIVVNVDTYTLRAGAGANGSITPAGVSTVPAGSNLSYSITPAPGYGVSALVVDGTTLPGATSYSFTNVTGNHFINAYFAPLQLFSIKAAAAANGSISSAGVSSVPAGSSMSYTITPAAGFRVAALVVDGATLPGATSYTFPNVSGNHYINAYFTPAGSFTLRAGAGANGAISPAGANVVTGGTDQTFTITPNPGYQVSALVVDGATLPGATSYTFSNVAANHYLNAYFAPQVNYSVRAGAGANGSISPAGVSSVAAGTTQSYSITPNAGFRVSALVVDGTALPGATEYSFSNVTGNHYINAYFAPL